ncbi:unnamed protein product [Coregonus sp. 'balchen']|nr:unnamed protein product [Coregonus sp. 'balchen']
MRLIMKCSGPDIDPGVAADNEGFLKKLQHEKPLIHMLHVEMVVLVREILSKFINPEAIPLSVKDLLKRDVTRKELQYPDKGLSVGKYSFTAMNKARMEKKPWFKDVYISLREGYMKATSDSVGITFLTELICKEAPPPGEEIDRMLSKRGSPTLHRKCSKVSELTLSWKEEKERNVETEGEFGDGRTCSVDTEDSGYSEAEERTLEAEGGQDKPGQRDNSKPGQMDSTEPGQTESNEPPGQTDSSKPEQTDISKPGQTALGHPGRPCRGTVTASHLKGKLSHGGKKELDDANKINALSKMYSAVGNLKSCWQNWSSTHTVNQKLNPFSEDFDYEYSMSLRLRKGEEGYGRPKEGTKTAERAR